MKFSTTTVLLATAAFSAAATIPVSNDAELEKRHSPSPGWRGGGDGNEFAWSKCTTEGVDTPALNDEQNGKMVKGDDPSQQWCWLTFASDGDKRINHDDVKGFDIQDGMPNPDMYSCLTWGAVRGTARNLHGGCFSQGI